MKRRRKFARQGIFLAVVGILAFIACPACYAGTFKIAVLPFTLHAPKDLDYLRDGIRTMLASRLSWENKVVIIDSAKVDAVMGHSATDLNDQKAVQIGRKLGADYVIYGSLTAVGNSVSMDSKTLAVKDGKVPVHLLTQSNSLDDVIPKIDGYAREINAKLFNRATPGQPVSQQAATETSMNPELLIPQMGASQGSISYLNPNFIQVTPDGAVRQPGFWRSQTLKGGIIGMDIGDLDGDGRQEIVTITPKKLIVYQRQAQGLKMLATFTGRTLDQFVWVALSDLNHDGRQEIYLTNMRTRNNPASNSDEAITPELSNYPTLDSMIFEMRSNRLRLISKRQPYFLNTVQLSENRRVLVGQKADYPDHLFAPQIFEMQLHGSTLRTGAPVNVPTYCNVFNFAMADINNDQQDEIVVITPDNRLRVLTPSGEQLWKSRKRFAATTNRLIGRVEDLRYNQIDFYFVPSPILISDLNQDGDPEVMVNRSPDYTTILPQGIKYYEAGEIVSLSWDQLGFVENWKTRELSGMVTAIRIGDLNNDGTPELVASLVKGKELVKFWKAQSLVLSYTINLNAKK